MILILILTVTVGVDSEELMGRAIELIVVCAQMNEHFSFMYAQLCKKITDKWSKGTENEVSNYFTFDVLISIFVFFRDKLDEYDQ